MASTVRLIVLAVHRCYVMKMCMYCTGMLTSQIGNTIYHYHLPEILGQHCFLFF